MNKTVLVLLPLSALQKDRLEAAAPDFGFVYSSPGLLDEVALASADILIGNLPAGRLYAADRLKWLQLNSAGYEDYVKSGILKPEVLLTNATGAYGQAVSEHMLAMLLSLMKKLPLYRDLQNVCRWGDEGPVSSILGSRVLIAGAGDIGCAFASLVKALGGYTVGLKRNISEKPAMLDELYTPDRLLELLPSMDIVASVMPDTIQTYHFFDRKAFESMKTGAILLNAGRGSAVDTDALCDALEHGPLAAAGLDVTDPEPLPAGHPLWSKRNVLITPHISGGFHLPATLDRIVALAAENLVRFRTGKELLNHIVRN